jgi:hypothetical protein
MTRIENLRSERRINKEEEKIRASQQRYQEAVNARKQIRQKAMHQSEKKTGNILKLSDIADKKFQPVAVDETELRNLIESGESDDDEAIQNYSAISGFR